MNTGGTETAVVPKKRRAGRPATDRPLKSLLSIKGSDEFEVWLDDLVEATHLGSRTQLIRNALRVYADQVGNMPKQPRR